MDSAGQVTVEENRGAQWQTAERMGREKMGEKKCLSVRAMGEKKRSAEGTRGG